MKCNKKDPQQLRIFFINLKSQNPMGSGENYFH